MRAGRGSGARAGDAGDTGAAGGGHWGRGWGTPGTRAGGTGGGAGKGSSRRWDRTGGAGRDKGCRAAAPVGRGRAAGAPGDAGGAGPPPPPRLQPSRAQARPGGGGGGCPWLGPRPRSRAGRGLFTCGGSRRGSAPRPPQPRHADAAPAMTLQKIFKLKRIDNDWSLFFLRFREAELGALVALGAGGGGVVAHTVEMREGWAGPAAPQSPLARPSGRGSRSGEEGVPRSASCSLSACLPEAWPPLAEGHGHGQGTGHPLPQLGTAGARTLRAPFLTASCPPPPPVQPSPPTEPLTPVPPPGSPHITSAVLLPLRSFTSSPSPHAINRHCPVTCASSRGSLWGSWRFWPGLPATSLTFITPDSNPKLIHFLLALPQEQLRPHFWVWSQRRAQPPPSRPTACRDPLRWSVFLLFFRGWSPSHYNRIYSCYLCKIFSVVGVLPSFNNSSNN